MNEMYERIQALCDNRGINITQMCKSAGVARAPLTELKMGRSVSLSVRNAEAIASYFGVSVSYLLGKEETKKELPDTNVGELDDPVLAELDSIIDSLSAEDREKMLQMIKLMFKK